MALQKSSSNASLKSSVIKKITADVEALWVEHGNTVDQDFRDDLDDVVSDLIEDRGPGYFKGMEKKDKHTEVVNTIMSDLD